MTTIGYSPLTEKIYLGQINPKKPGWWVGNKKRDITSEFIAVMLQKFEPGFEHTIDASPSGKVYKVRVIEVDEKEEKENDAI